MRVDQGAVRADQHAVAHARGDGLQDARVVVVVGQHHGGRGRAGEGAAGHERHVVRALPQHGEHRRGLGQDAALDVHQHARLRGNAVPALQLRRDLLGVALKLGEAGLAHDGAAAAAEPDRGAVAVGQGDAGEGGVKVIGVVRVGVGVGVGVGHGEAAARVRWVPSMQRGGPSMRPTDALDAVWVCSASASLAAQRTPRSSG